jgi:hypothetical protein
MHDRMTGGEGIALGGIVFTAERVFEGTPSRPTVGVARSRIDKIRLRYGSVASHPIVLALLGLIMVGLGLVPLGHAALWVLRGGVYYAAEAFMLVWLPLGVGALFSVFRRGYVLDVQTSAGLRIFAFRRGTNRQEVEQFVRDAEHMFGYPIERGEFSGG